MMQEESVETEQRFVRTPFPEAFVYASNSGKLENGAQSDAPGARTIIVGEKYPSGA
jgi:hypothetical protein